MHDDGAIDTSTQKRKPEMIVFYNQTKGSVDALDKLAHCSTTKRKSKRWPMVMFANVLDLATVAGICVFRIKFPDHKLSSKDARGGFIRQVSKQLMLRNLQRRVQIMYLPRELSILATTAINEITKLCEMTAPSTSSHATSSSVTKRPGTSCHSAGGPDQPDTEKLRKRQRCTFCSWKKDRKTNQRCNKCMAFVCPEHALKVCPSCSKQ